MDTLGAALGVLLAYYFITVYRGDYSRVFLWAMLPAFLGVGALFFAREAHAQAVSSTSDTARQDRGNDSIGQTNAQAQVAGTHNRSLPLFQWSKLDRRLRGFLIIVFLFALGNSSNQFLLLRAGNLGFGPATVLLVYFLYNMVYSLLSYPMGRLSDRIGRKTLLVVGYATYGLVYLGFAFAREPWHVWVLFGVYGVCIALTEGSEKALVADIAPADLRATTIGLHATLVGIGLLPASLLAGFLWDLLGPQAAFALGGLTGLLSALGIWLVL